MDFCRIVDGSADGIKTNPIQVKPQTKLGYDLPEEEALIPTVAENLEVALKALETTMSS